MGVAVEAHRSSFLVVYPPSVLRAARTARPNPRASDRCVLHRLRTALGGTAAPLVGARFGSVARGETYPLPPAVAQSRTPRSWQARISSRACARLCAIKRRYRRCAEIPSSLAWRRAFQLETSSPASNLVCNVTTRLLVPDPLRNELMMVAMVGHAPVVHVLHHPTVRRPQDHGIWDPL
jgi:hypothetical protein